VLVKGAGAGGVRGHARGKGNAQEGEGTRVRARGGSTGMRGRGICEQRATRAWNVLSRQGELEHILSRHEELSKTVVGRGESSHCSNKGTRGHYYNRVRAIYYHILVGWYSCSQTKLKSIY